MTGRLHAISKGFQSLFINFLFLTKLLKRIDPVDDRVVHYIVTSGPPVTALPHRLQWDQLPFAKRQFADLMADGIGGPS